MEINVEFNIILLKIISIQVILIFRKNQYKEGR